jgi:casein kinase II subunit beta
MDIYTPPNSRFHSVDGAFFGTTFGCLFFMTFPDLDIGPRLDASLSIMSPRSAAPTQSRTGSVTRPQPSRQVLESPTPENQPLEINGVRTSNLCPGLGKGKIYDPRIYGFKVSEVSRVGPRMKWLRTKPKNVIELDEAWNNEQELLLLQAQAKDDKDGDTVMKPEQVQDAAIANRKKAPMRRRRQGLDQSASADPMDVHGR